MRSVGGPVVKPGLILPSPATDKVPLTVRGEEEQTANLQEWQEHGEAVLFAVRADGNLATAKSVSATTPGDVIRKLPIYAPGGSTALGYIAISDAID